MRALASSPMAWTIAFVSLETSGGGHRIWGATEHDAQWERVKPFVINGGSDVGWSLLDL
jgi:hypothetical protein